MRRLGEYIIPTIGDFYLVDNEDHRLHGKLVQVKTLIGGVVPVVFPLEDDGHGSTPIGRRCLMILEKNKYYKQKLRR